MAPKKAPTVTRKKSARLNPDDSLLESLDNEIEKDTPNDTEVKQLVTHPNGEESHYDNDSDEYRSIDYDELSSKHEALEEKYSDLLKKHNVLQESHDLLRDTVIKISKKLLYLESRSVDQMKRSMSDNIVISGCKEDTDDPEKELIKFVKTNLKIDVKSDEILKAHRMGAVRKPRRDETEPNPRPLVAKLDPKKKESIMNNVKKLAKKKGPNGKPLVISQQEPEAISEHKKQLRFRLKQAKQRYVVDRPRHQRVEVKIVNDQVYVNNTPQKLKVRVPSTEEVLTTPADERKRLTKMKITRTPWHSPELVHEGSRFYAYALKAYNTDQVQRAYLKVKLENPTADDIMCSFSVKDEYNYQISELHDDHEHGAASRILSAIQTSKKENVAVFVVRQFDNKHIGYKRFELINKAASMALDLV